MRTTSRLPSLAAAVALTAFTIHAPAAAAATPTLSFWANDTSITAGETIRLTWHSTNASRCLSSGAWPAGPRKVDASIRVRDLQSSASYTLTCFGDGTSVRKTVAVTVADGGGGGGGGGGDPVVTPTLKLQASANSVLSGEDVKLTWTGSDLSSCEASGSWNGARPTSGTETRSALTASESYTLSCGSASGTIMAMTTVKVTSGGTQLSWTPPEERIDGSPLTDLAAYRIYVGTVSRDYYDEIELPGAAKTEHFVNLEPGEYYLAMTAVDADGNESALSNEVRKVVQ